MIEKMNAICQKLCASGAEATLREYLQAQLLPIFDKVYIDPVGNLIAYKKGSGEGRLVLSAPMDMEGIVVCAADEKGMLRIAAVGSASPTAYLYQTIRFENGCLGVLYPSSDKKDISFADCYVDIGTKTKTEALEKVSLGMCGVLTGTYQWHKQRWVGPGMETAAACLVLLEAVRDIGEASMDTLLVFTVQHQVGERGAAVAAFSLEGTLWISVGGTSAGGYSGAPADSSAKFGEGAAIRVRDAKTICDATVIETLENKAHQKMISVQREVVSGDSCQAAAALFSGRATQVGALSIPVMHRHSAIATVCPKDIEACIALVKSMI